MQGLLSGAEPEMTGLLDPRQQSVFAGLAQLAAAFAPSTDPGARARGIAAAPMAMVAAQRGATQDAFQARQMREYDRRSQMDNAMQEAVNAPPGAQLSPMAQRYQQTLASLPENVRSALPLLSPEQRGQFLGRVLGQAPERSTFVIPPGGNLVGADGRPIFTAPFAPRAEPAPMRPRDYMVFAPDGSLVDLRELAGAPGAAGGGAAPTAPSTAAPRPAGGAPQPAADIRALNAAAATERQRIMDNPDLSPEEKAAALTRISAWRAAAGGTPERPGGYSGATATGFADGLPPPSGVVTPVQTPTQADSGAGVARRPGVVLPAPSQEVWAPLSPQDAQMRGLPDPGPGRAWQRNSRTGEVKAVGGSGVTINQTGENAYDKGRAASLNTFVEGIEKAGRGAANQLMRFSQIERDLERFTTGAGSEGRIRIGQMASLFGVPDSVLTGLGLDKNAIAAGENIRSLGFQLLQGVIGSGEFPSNNFSEGDRNAILSANPGVFNSPEGNRAIIRIQRAAAERNREVWAAWRSWSKDNGDSLDSARRFQNEVLPTIQARDIFQPILQDAFPDGYDRPMSNPQPAPAGIPGPNGAGTAQPPPSASGEPVTRRFRINPQTGRFE